jgi:phage tail-like protein
VRSGTITIPSLKGLSLKQAELVLSSRGLAVGSVAQIHTGDQLSGAVIETSPPAGQQVPRGVRVDLTVAIATSLYAYLPAIYAAVDSDDNPITALLSLWYGLYDEFEDRHAAVDEVFDPRRAPDDPRRDFLSWLARWVALDPADEVFAGEPGAANRQRLRSSIELATALYARRGTIGGLCDLVEVFLGEKITIVEWAWPIGLKIGQASTIGVDTFLTEHPALDACFMVSWHRQFHMSEQSNDALVWLSIPLAGGERDKVVSTAMAAGPEAAARVPWFSEVRRLRHLLDMEKPAHTACFLALDMRWPMEPRAPAGDVMIIGVISTIGLCSIERPA